jgi:Zn-dependent peptidase ImmA (M78 family)/DNA-binding XRE family transcriptional regulator
MNTTPNPEMLVLARQIRGMTQKDLAEISGISQGTISKGEGNLIPLAELDLEAMAEALDFPLKFFYRPGNRKGPETNEIFHRKRQSLPVKQLHIIHAKLNMHRLNVETLLEAADVEAREQIPRYRARDFDGDIEYIAELVRSAWKMPSGPVSNMTKVLEDAFCIIHKCDFGTNLIDETVQWIDPLPPIILVNNQVPSDRLRFTLAHTLGHLVLHHDEEPYQEMEEEADQFASAFLMPRNDIESELEPTTLEHLIRLKPTWKVSVAALIRRARDIGKIDDRRYTSLFQMLSRAGYRKNEPFQLPLEEPTLLKRLIDLYQVDLEYSTEDLAQLLAISKDDFVNWYLPGQWRPHVIRGEAKRSSNNPKLEGSS